MPNQIQVLHQETRNHIALRSLIVLEAVLSYPIPYRSGESLYLRFLFFDTGRKDPETGKVSVYNPHARISVSYPQGKLVEYVALDFETGQSIAQLDRVIGEYPHAAMANLDFKAAKARRTALFYYTQQVIPLYGRADLTAAERQTVQTYWDTFDEVAELPLRPYYEALSPAFFAWIREVLK